MNKKAQNILQNLHEQSKLTQEEKYNLKHQELTETFQSFVNFNESEPTWSLRDRWRSLRIIKENNNIIATSEKFSDWLIINSFTISNDDNPNQYNFTTKTLSYFTTTAWINPLENTPFEFFDEAKNNWDTILLEGYGKMLLNKETLTPEKIETWVHFNKTKIDDFKGYRVCEDHKGNISIYNQEYQQGHNSKPNRLNEINLSKENDTTWKVWSNFVIIWNNSYARENYVPKDEQHEKRGIYTTWDITYSIDLSQIKKFLLSLWAIDKDAILHHDMKTKALILKDKHVKNRKSA